MSLHLSVGTPMMEPEYKVRLLATPAFDITYSVTRFAPVIKAAFLRGKEVRADGEGTEAAQKGLFREGKGVRKVGMTR